MNKNVKFSLVSLIFLLAGCKGSVSSSITESTNSTNKVSSSVVNSEVSSSSSISESTSSSEVNPYGELIIPTMKIFTNFPDTPLPTFTNEEYKSEITYNVIDTDIVEYKDGYIVGKKAGAAMVEATTEYHKTTFKVSCYNYTGGDWYVNRVASVESKWINAGRPEVDTLFIGDSFFDTEFWSDFYTLFNDNKTFTHGVSSSTTTDWEIFASRLVYPVNPKNIVMHLGTNNLYDDKETSSEAYKNTVRLLETIHSRLPETKVYYFSIEPRTYAIEGGTFSQTSFDKIDKVNKDMEAYCNENDYMVYVDATSECYKEGIEVNADFFRDGIHPKLGNYMTYVNLLKEAGLELNLNESILNTKEFNIAKTSGIASTNNIIKANGSSLTYNYSVSGKLKVTETGSNSHIQFSLDSTNFQNRFLLWDNDSNGSFIPGYAIGGNHQANQGNANITKDVEATFEVVTTEKHSYFYVNNSLEFVFLNVNAREFMIGAENTAVSFYDINVVTSKDDSWNNVLAREEINKYETSTETAKKAVVI